jgi:D-alanine-D-alanine ligase
VKPLTAGSSVGITIVKTFFDLEKALERAFEHSDIVIIEEYIEGREVTCGVIDGFRGHKTYPLFPTEIVPKSGFYDYHAKYESDDTGYICPAIFDEKTKETIQEAAKAVHEHLGLRHYSRSDFIVHPRRGVYFLEVNTLPGMTSHSLIPRAVEAAGSNLSEFFDHVISLARNG